MEAPISIVRNNPFVKNDGCRRIFRRSPVVVQKSSGPAPSIPPSLGFRVPVMERSEEAQDNISTGSASDIEYGPGIVEKLKAKFHRLSGLASRDAKVSPHATGKRCPSMDDILAAPEEHRVFSPPPQNLSPLHRTHSKSTSDMVADPAVEERRAFHVHRVVRIEKDEDEDQHEVPSISTLRRKFEQNVQRRPSQNMRYAKSHSTLSNDSSNSRPISMDLSHHEMTSSFHDAPPPRSMRLEAMTSPPLPTTQSPPIYQNTSQFYGQDARQHSEEHAAVLPRVLSPAYGRDERVASERMSATPAGDTYRTTTARERIASTAPTPMRVYEAKKTVKEESAPLRILEVLNRASSPEQDDEPEFVKIGRRLRRSSFILEDNEERVYSMERVQTMQKDERPEIVKNVERIERDEREPVETAEVTRFSLRGRVELPSLSAHARVIREGAAPRAADVQSPPDPDSARQRASSDVSLVSPTFVMREERTADPEASPPPEEPRPRTLVLDSFSSRPPIQHPPAVLSPPPVLSGQNDDSGVSEMQMMLTRFQRNRGSRYMTEEQPERTSPAVTVAQHIPSPPRPFVPAVVGVRYSDDVTTQLGPAPSPIRTNVVSISVRDDSPTFAFHNNNNYKHEEETGISPVSTGVTKRQAPPPPPQETAPQCEPVPSSAPKTVPQATDSASKPAPLMTDTPRKSLSAIYLEEKSKQVPPQTREKPYGDDVTEIKSEPKESSVDDPVEVEAEVATSTAATPHITAASFLKDSDVDFSSSDSDSDEPPMTSRPYTMNYPEPVLAGDGNVIRHTLLQLVMEEDIPSLLEAMSEKYSFEFVDLENAPSTSSIIHPQQKRQQRRKERQVSSIRFQTADPLVYTYLNESTTVSSQEWLQGTEVDYDAYQRMIDSEQDDWISNNDLKSNLLNRIFSQGMQQSSQMDWTPEPESSSIELADPSSYTSQPENSTSTISV